MKPLRIVRAKLSDGREVEYLQIDKLAVVQDGTNTRLHYAFRTQSGTATEYAIYAEILNERGGEVIVDAQQIALLIACGIAFAAMGLLAFYNDRGNLNIKGKTVGDGQHGSARWATEREIRETFHHAEFSPEQWRRGENLPTEQGIIVGTAGTKKRVVAQVDTDDVHALMIGAAGVGKTAYFMIPNIEYVFASGTSIMVSDTKGDLYRQYAPIAREIYGYEVGVLDLRNPARSDGFNMLNLICRYTDEYAETGKLSAKAKAER